MCVDEMSVACEGISHGDNSLLPVRQYAHAFMTQARSDGDILTRASSMQLKGYVHGIDS